MTTALPVEPFRHPVDAVVDLPGSKSITIRALLVAALADADSTLEGMLISDDTDAMVGALRDLGIPIEVAADGTTAVVTGCAGTIPALLAGVDLARSATSARLLLAAVALGSGTYVVDGHPQLRARPMGPGVAALRSLGAEVDETAPGFLPVTVSGGPVAGGRVHLPGDVSSQFVSGLLIAGRCMPAGIEIELTTDLVSEPYVEMTRAVMAAFGAPVDGLRVEPGPYVGRRYVIEPDASAASYVLALAAATRGQVVVPGLGRRSIQGDVGFADVLARMGADVVVLDDAIEVRGTGVLHGIDVDLNALSDTAPTLGALAALATGTTRVRGIGFIRAKESNRIEAVVTELRRLGIDATEDDDGFTIVGGPTRPASVRTYDDHRMAMAFAVLGSVREGIVIEDPDCVAKTFPGFWTTLAALRSGRMGR